MRSQEREKARAGWVLEATQESNLFDEGVQISRPRAQGSGWCCVECPVVCPKVLGKWVVDIRTHVSRCQLSALRWGMWGQCLDSALGNQGPVG